MDQTAKQIQIVQVNKGSQVFDIDKQTKTLENFELPHILDQYRKKLRTILRKFDLQWDGHLKKMNITKYRIDTAPNAQSVMQRPCLTSMEARGFVTQEFQRPRKANFIEWACQELTSPIVTLLENDWHLRMYIDYLKLVAITVLDTCSLAMMDNCVDLLEDAALHSAVYASLGYWHAPIADGDKEKTTKTSQVVT